MTCKDCYHCEVCENRFAGLRKICVDEPVKHLELNPSVEKCCENFKDKSKIIEIPCTVGDEIYCINGDGSLHKSKVHCLSKGGKFSNDWQFHIYDADGDNSTVMLRNFGKQWFVNKQTAEARAKELNENDKS